MIVDCKQSWSILFLKPTKSYQTLICAPETIQYLYAVYGKKIIELVLNLTISYGTCVHGIYLLANFNINY